MSSFERIPLLRFLLPLLAGIIAGKTGQIGIEALVFILTCVLFTFLLYILFKKKENERNLYQTRWVEGLLITVALIISGNILYYNYNALNNSKHFTKQPYNGNYVLVEVSEPPITRKKAVKTVIEVIAVKRGQQWVKTNGKVVQYFEMDTNSLYLDYGDRIIQRAQFTNVSPPLNPHEFNYRQYLADDNIFHQSYIKTGQWKKVGSGYGNPINRLGNKARNFLQEKLKSTGLEGDAYAVVLALLLGVRDKLDADVLKSYSAAGTIHILCVSGLHVGIIFLLISQALAFLNKKSWGNVIQALSIILFIWFYALITGLAPSVQRAATMFTVIVIGKFFRRQTSIYNTLALSAGILIIITPGIISKPGFWLSYLAVLGIVYLYPKIYGLIKIRNKIIEKIWALLCVSLAAQIATSPLSIYYFNQFPNYFLISNIIVVPLATLIVYVGISLIIFSFIPIVSDFIAWVLTYMLKSLNFTVYGIEHLPFSTSVIVIDCIQMGLLYLFLFFLFFYLECKKVFLLKTSLIIFLLTLMIFSMNTIRNQHSKEVTFYVQDKGTAIDIRSGTNVVFIADSIILNNPALVDFHIKGNRTKKGVRHITKVSLADIAITDTIIGKNICMYHHFFAINKNRFLLLDKQLKFKSINAPVCDYIYISSKANKKNTAFIKASEVKKLILASGMSLFKKTELQNALPYTKGYMLYDLKKRGALTIKPF